MKMPFYITEKQLAILQDALQKESQEDELNRVEIIKMQTQLDDLQEWVDEIETPDVTEEEMGEIKAEEIYYTLKYGDHF